MDTDDDVSTLEEEEASLSESTYTYQSEIRQDHEDMSNDEIEANAYDALHVSLARLTGTAVKFVTENINTDEGQVKFQVMCAHTEESDAQKFVVYTIVVERGEDNRPAILERRYSDFLSLFTSLKQSHPALLSHIKFPRKVLMGNFRVGVIEERSNCFERFLHHIYSKDVLKCSEPFKNFLYRRETQESSHYLLHSQYEEAIPLLENLYWLINKLHGDRDHVLRVLLQLLVSLHAVGNFELAHDYALLALPRFEARKIEGNCLARELYVPFLQFCVRLWWMLGRNRTLFENMLKEVKDEGKRTEGLPDLLDSLRDQISLPSLRF